MSISKISPALLSRLIVLGVLVAGTIGFFNWYERYEPVGAELLIDSGFQEDFTHWQRSGRGVARIEEGMVSLRAEEPSADVAVRQSLSNSQRYRLLRLSGELKAEDIRPGKRFWHKGRLVLVSFDNNQRMLPVPHVVADLHGTDSWRSYQGIFRIPDEAQEVRVGIQLIGATGTLLARNLSLREIQQRDGYTLYWRAGIAVWGMGLLWLSLPLLPRLRLDVPHLLIYVAMAGIFIGTLMPLQLKMEMEFWIGAGLSQMVQMLGTHGGTGQGVSLAQVLLDSLAISKAGHFLFFALLAFALCWAYPRERRLLLLVGLLSVALVSEVLQFFVDNRLPQVKDFLIDGVGALLGIGLFEVQRWLMLTMARKGVTG